MCIRRGVCQWVNGELREKQRAREPGEAADFLKEDLEKRILSIYFMFEHSNKKVLIDHKSKLPLHVQVEDYLRKLIGMDKFKNGTFLPKEVEMANRLGVSRNTIRQATNKLENEGLIIRKKGVGTRVAERKGMMTGLDHWYSFTQEMHEKGIVVSNLQLRIEWVPVSETIRNFFNVEADRKILKLSKLKGEESGEPIVYFESWFHPRIEIGRA